MKCKRTVESLKIAMEEKLELKSEPTGVDTEKVLRKEIALLKDENEALRKELKKKELILQSVKHVETSKPKLPRSIWSDDDEDLVSPTIPTYSKEVKFRYPQQKHTGKAKNVASLTSHDVGFIHMNRFGAIGGEELDFPDSWKVARITPIFKDGDRTEKSNYRPISVLPVISKLFEKLVFNQLYQHMKDNGLFTSDQSGFLRLHSTLTCLLKMSDDWYNGLDLGKLVG